MRPMAWAPVVLAVLLLLCGTAEAAPVTVDLRIEGATATLFEGPVTTDGKVITVGGTTLTCDGTGHPGNTGPAATPISALEDAHIPGGWDNKFGADFVSRIGAEPETASQFWGIAVNYRPLLIGGCQQQVSAGDEVLFAFDFFGGPPNFTEKPLLRLASPPQARTGQPVPVAVAESELLFAPFPEPRELQQRPAAGAVVEGATTDSSGAASVSFASPGLKRLKAERPGSIRSNAVLLCVSDAGTDDCGVPPGQLGTPAGRGTVTDSTAPTARISGPRHGRRYRRGPRLLRGTARDDGSGVQEVKLSIRRHTRGRGCQWWSGRRDRFVGRNCRKTFFFAIGQDARWSYLLPRPLGPGRYVIDLKVFDTRRNRNERFTPGENRVVFEVLKPRRRASTAAAPARVETMVVGRKDVIARPARLRAKATKVRASGRACAVAQSTPLAALRAALARARVGFAVRDFGSCKERATRDSGQLFVTRIGRERNSGQDGWVYKVNDRAPGRGAADSRVRTGDRVVWLYCRQDASGGCQRSLRVIPAKRSGRLGESLAVRVFGYDDRRKRQPIAGARVTLTAGREEIRSAVTAADGSALLTFPGAGAYTLAATADGLVPAFPIRIRSR